MRKMCKTLARRVVQKKAYADDVEFMRVSPQSESRTGWRGKMCKPLVVSLGKMCYTIFDLTQEGLVM